MRVGAKRLAMSRVSDVRREGRCGLEQGRIGCRQGPKVRAQERVIHARPMRSLCVVLSCGVLPDSTHSNSKRDPVKWPSLPALGLAALARFGKSAL